MTIELFSGGSAFRPVRDFRNSDAFSSKSFLCQSAIFWGGMPQPPSVSMMECFLKKLRDLVSRTFLEKKKGCLQM